MENKEEIYNTEVGEYKGSAMITIKQGDRRVLGFGLKKAHI